jgi:hypothetical protein
MGAESLAPHQQGLLPVINNHLSIYLTIIAVIARIVVVKDVLTSKAVSIGPPLPDLMLPLTLCLPGFPFPSVV